MRTKTRYRKLQAFADGGTVEAVIPEAPLVTAAPIPDPVIEPELVQEDDDLAQSGLPDSAQKWLRSRPEFLYDPDASAKLGHTDDRDHLFRSIATSVARVLTAPLDDGGDVSLLMAGQAR